MKYKALVLLAALGAAAVSCTFEEMSGPQENVSAGIAVDTRLHEVVVSATMDGDDGTRTSLEHEGTDMNIKQVNWTPGDKIKIFSAGESAEFTSLNTEPVRIAKFKGLVSFITGADDGSETDYVWGLYPYREEASYYEPTPGVSRTALLTTTLPEIQQGKDDTFDDGLAISIGRSESLSIAFKNVYSGLRFTLTRSDINAVTFKGNNGEALAGGFTVGMDDEITPPVPVVRQVYEPATSVTLLPPEGGTFTAGKTYYIVTLPQNLTKGFSVTLQRSDGYSGTFKYTSARNFKRNDFTRVKEVDGRITEWTPASAAAPNQIEYTSSDDEIVSYSVDGATGNEVVSNTAPKDNDGKGVITFAAPVTVIDDRAFFNKANLTSVKLPSTTQEIGWQSFAMTGLTQLDNLPDNLKRIGRFAFMGCEALQSVTIPDQVESLGYHNMSLVPLGNPFSGCTSLTHFYGKWATEDHRALILDSPNGKTYFISYAAGNSATTYAVPEVDAVANSAFSSTNLTEISLPDGLESIFDEAFYGSSHLTSLTIPASVSRIASCIVGECPALESVTILSPTVPTLFTNYYQLVQPVDQSETGCPIYVPANLLGAYRSHAQWGFYSSRYVALPDENQVVYKATQKVEIVDIQESITHEFDTETGMGVITFAEAPTEIPAGFFRYATALTEVILPNSVTAIGDNAFFGCRALSSIKMDGVTAIGPKAFENTTALTDIKLPEGLVAIGAGAFSNSGLTDITIPASVEYVSARWTSFPDMETVREGNNNPFQACANLRTIKGKYTLNDRFLVKDQILRAYAVKSSEVNHLITPEGVTEIGANAFSGSPYLESITVSEGVTSIGQNAFSNVALLTEINLPASVTQLGTFCFYGSSQLTTLNMKAITPPQTQSMTFEGCANILTVRVPGAGYGLYTDSGNAWATNARKIIPYQTDREIWFHCAGNNDYSDFSALISMPGMDIEQRGLLVPSGASDDISLWEPAVPFPDGFLPADPVSLVLNVVSYEQDLTEIPADAFAGFVGNTAAGALDYVSLPPGILAIGARAFRNCADLMTFPLSKRKDVNNGTVSYVNITQEIGEYAFEGCKAMAGEIELGNTAPSGEFLSLGEKAFNGCENLTKVTIGKLTEIPRYAFWECKNLTAVYLSRPDLLTTIRYGAFESDSKLATVTGSGSSQTGLVLNGVTTIEGSAFYLTALQTADLPNMTFCGGRAFQNCTRLSSFNAPRLEKLDAGTNFTGCWRLTSLDLPSLTSYRSQPFPYNLQTLHLGADITSMTEYLTANPSSNTAAEFSLYIDATTPPAITSITFKYTNLKLVAVPDNSVAAYKSAWEASLTACGISTSVIKAQSDVE